VPIDEEQPDFALEIRDEVQRTLQGMIVSSGLAGFLHHSIPVAGPAVIELMTDLAIQRTNKRMYDMFEHFTNRIREIGEQNVDREWFRSEEFQTLLFEALRQLHVTHDREKIEMLGAALANSGAPSFKDEERKRPLHSLCARSHAATHQDARRTFAPAAAIERGFTAFVSR
jgi:hypothetical protein